jgi:hypothetical protein
MRLPNMLLSIAAIAAMAANSQMGTTIRVAVGEGESLRYSPNNITAKVGTAIEFNFFPNVSNQVENLPTKLIYCRIILSFNPPLPIPVILSQAASSLVSSQPKTHLLGPASQSL